MYRSKRLVVRLTKHEADAVQEFARTERLPASTLARALLLKAAEQAKVKRNTRAAGGEEVCHEGTD